MSSLIASSSHQRLKSSVRLFIEPLLRELFLHCFSTGDGMSLCLCSYEFLDVWQYFFFPFLAYLKLTLYLVIYSMVLAFHSNLGYAWLRIGALRFHLLIGCDVLDPAMKYSWKCSQLEEKISLLKLEIKVPFLTYVVPFHDQFNCCM